MFPLSQATQKINSRRLLSYESSCAESSESYVTKDEIDQKLCELR
jgi:hypothetical protein